MSVKKLLVAATTAALMLPSVSHAKQDMDFAKIYVDCGLGGMVGSAFDDDQATLSKVLAISTNVIWDLGTTASTSYFSSQETCYNNKAHMASFINQSYEKLEQDLANGQGEYLDALTTLAVEDDSTKAVYQTNLRQNFAAMVADDSYAELSRYQKVEKLFEMAI